MRKKWQVAVWEFLSASHWLQVTREFGLNADD